MANIALAYPNRFDAAAVSGQGWLSTLPLSYLKTRQIAQVARSHFAISKFYAAFSAATAARLVGLVGHNMSTSAKVRVRGYSSDPRPRIDRSAQIAVLDMDFAEGIPAASVSCSRASSGTYFDANLVLQTAGNNVARFTYDPNTGAALGLLAEGASTNYMLWCRDWSNAAWTKSNCTATKTATGVDGVANSASVLTATAANGQVTQARATGLSGYVSVLARRVSGSGNVLLTGDNFATSTAMALTGSWKRFWIYTNAGTTTLGVRLATSGDVIEVDFAQFESGWQVTSPILTTTASGNRSTDTLTISVPSHLAPNTLSGSWVAKLRACGRYTSAGANIMTASGAGQSLALRDNGGGLFVIRYGATDTHQTATQTAIDTDYIVASSHSNGAHDARINGGFFNFLANPATSAAAVTTITISPDRSGFAFSRLTFFGTTQTGTELADFSTLVTPPAPGYDSGLLDAWPAAWAAGTTAEQRAGARDVALADLGADRSYAWWRIDISDPTNAAGYVQVGRPFMGSAWQPITNMSYGCQIGYIPRESVSETDSGAEYFVSRPNRRVIRFSLDWLTEAEAMGQVLEMQRQLGTTGELLVAWDLDDTLQRPRRTFLARMRTLGELNNIFHNIWTARFELGELL